MKKSFFVIMAAFTLFSCGEKAYVSDLKTPSIDEFDYKVEEFADMGILRYRVPDIESLSTAQKELLYYRVATYFTTKIASGISLSAVLWRQSIRIPKTELPTTSRAWSSI